MNTIGEPWMWCVFFIFVAVMLSVDFFLLGGKKAHRVSIKESLSWTMVWVACAFLFNFLLWHYLKQSHPDLANQRSVEFLTGYLIEKSLSIDNIFIILMIFNYFAIPPEYQRRVLLFGVLGAIVMRLVLILFGIWVISRFEWVLYLFGIFLLITGVKMFVFANEKPNLAANPILLWMKNHLRITPELHYERFSIVKNKLRYVTPLFVVLVLVEISDLIFAVDSIPAVFAITHDPFIVFTSNIFAILGLRALYFLLSDMNDRFHLLKFGIAFILVFIGIKMLIVHWIKIPALISFAVVATILIFTMLLSVYQNKKTVRRIKN